MKCDECGEWVDQRGRKCPRCGESLRPEFKRHIREEVRPATWMAVLSVTVLVGALIGCYAMWWAGAHYSWDEQRASVVSDMEDNEYTTFVPVRVGKVTTLTPVHHDDNIVTCEDGHTDMVSQSKYDSTSVGDTWNYTVTHYDWKPGMEDSPTPAWVFIAPATIFALILGVYLGRIAYIRHREMREFDLYGDIEIGSFSRPSKYRAKVFIPLKRYKRLR